MNLEPLIRAEHSRQTRGYRLGAREKSTAETRARILAATFDLATEQSRVQLVLADIAARAGVSVQTILRHFGTREGLFLAVLEYAGAEIEAERDTPPGDIARAVTTIVSHYESRGDTVFRWLMQEFSSETAARVTEQGKQVHRRWVETAFAPYLAPLVGEPRDASVDLLVVATDLFTWKLLRRDRGLDRATVESRILTLIHLVLERPI